MQSARSTQSFNPIVIALPIAALLGVVAVLALFFLIGAMPTGAMPTASPIAQPQAIIEPTPQPPTYVDTPVLALNCLVVNSQVSDLLVRSAPADAYAPLGMITTGTGIQALGRTMTQPVWYAVGYAERRGWIAENAAILQGGDCASLPTVRNPLIPDAPQDPPAHVIAVDRDGSGTFYERISAPTGDIEDLVWVRVINLYTEPPNNFREFTVRLQCNGTGVDAVRWGMVGSPTLRCGEEMTFPFIYGSSDRPLTVQFPGNSQQSSVEYALQVRQRGADV